MTKKNFALLALTTLLGILCFTFSTPALASNTLEDSVPTGYKA